MNFTCNSKSTDELHQMVKYDNIWKLLKKHIKKVIIALMPSSEV